MRIEEQPYSQIVSGQLRKAARLVNQRQFEPQHVEFDPDGGPEPFSSDSPWLGRIALGRGRELWLSGEGIVSVDQGAESRLPFTSILDVGWPPAGAAQHDIIRAKRERGTWLVVSTSGGQTVALRDLGAAFQDLFHLFRLVLRKRSAA